MLGDVEPLKTTPHGKKRLYSVGCCVTNGGGWRSRGIDKCRVTNAVAFIYGPIFADDKVWIGNVDVFAEPGEYKLRWVIKSEDERVPKRGYSDAVPLRLL